MIMMRVVWVVLGVLLPASVMLAGPVTIYSDGFESGDFSAWSGTTGNWSVITSALSAHTGLHGANVAGASGAKGDVLSVQVSTAGFEQVELEYALRIRDDFESPDHMDVGYRSNGGAFRILNSHVGEPAGDWWVFTFDLPDEASNNANLEIEFVAHLGSGADRANLDDVTITATPVPEPAGLVLLASASGTIIALRRRF